MKKNGFISKQLQKMIAPIIDRFLYLTYNLVEQLIGKEFMNYDDYNNLCQKVYSYEKYEKYILDKLKEEDYGQ